MEVIKSKEQCQSLEEHQQLEFEQTHVYQHQSDVLQIFKAFADAKRLKIILALYEYDQLCVQQVAKLLDESVATTSHHLRALKRANLAQSQREGKHIIYRLADNHVYTIVEQAYEHALHECTHEGCESVKNE
ncbi:MAG: ArsR/SmtB family transcription factor [Culicoidibacterales bacterium]